MHHDTLQHKQVEWQLYVDDGSPILATLSEYYMQYCTLSAVKKERNHTGI